MNKTATVYLRFCGDIRCIAYQRVACYRAAYRLGARVVAEYVEQESGRTRPELDAMLHDLTGSQTTNLLVVASADRLTRRAEIWHRISKRLARVGTCMVTADAVGWDDAHAHLLHMLVQGTLAERQRHPRTKEGGHA